MDKKINLLVITQKVDLNDSNLGFFHRWLEEFSYRTENLYVVTGAVGKVSLPGNVRVFSMGKEKGFGRIRRYINFYRYLFNILPKVDGVLVHMIPIWVVIAWPLALVFRKNIYLWYTHKSVTASLRIAEKMVKNIFTASKESCRLLSRKIIITGHGIDTEKFKIVPRARIQGEGLRVVSIGRISAVKNYDMLVRAFALVKRPAQLDIFGPSITAKDIQYLNNLKKLISDLGLGNRIFLHPPFPYSEVQKIYQGADITIHLSRTGSVDKVVLESLACGVPVFSSSEAFVHILPSKYLLPNDEPGTIAEQIEKFNPIKLQEQEFLSETVRRDHNLTTVVGKIIDSVFTVS